MLYKSKVLWPPQFLLSVERFMLILESQVSYIKQNWYIQVLITPRLNNLLSFLFVKG